jgi:hypothetical protein
VAGRPRISCESFTWLSEHFQSDLGRLKHFTDYLFLCGINHIVFHGTTYSPDDAAWPGWLFYASSQINPRNPIWRDLPELNTYITRCQSLLQTGRPDHDVLLYWPIDDDWMAQGGLRSGFSIDGGHWRVGKGFRDTAKALWEARVLFDYVSDRQLADARTENGRIVVPGGEYRAVVLPPLHVLRPEAARHLLRLAEGGAKVVALSPRTPLDVPGLAQLEERRADLQKSWSALAQAEGFRQRTELLPILAELGVKPDEILKAPGLRVERRRLSNGDTCYFIANRGGQPVRQWTIPSRSGENVCLLDPWTGQAGQAKRRADGRVFLSLEPGETRFLIAGDSPTSSATWQDYIPDPDRSQPVSGPWRVSFIDGGPVRPRARLVEALSPYTSWDDAELQRFAGTARYGTGLRVEPAGDQEWILDLGEVHGSARVSLNGVELGVRVASPYRFVVPAESLQKLNKLVVDVTGTAANRIRDMDRRGVGWRIFRDINFVNRDYKRFSAADWGTVPAGLVGPVRLYAASRTRE